MHRDRRISAVREAMATGIDGVINVVSYGYHEYRIGKEEAIEANHQIREDFLDKHRQVEIDLMKEWNSLLGDRETAHWLITLVTKADLWWDRREQVLTHYEKGDYYQALGDAKDLRPVVLPYSSVFHKFFGEGALSGQFDDRDRVLHKSHVFSQLIAAIGKSVNG